jgi:hypothetical protein
VSLYRVSKGLVRNNLVAVAAPLPRPCQISSRRKFRNDPLDCPFRDTDPHCDVTCTNRAILMDTDQHVGMVRKEGP